jgi:heme oxygenase
VTTAQTMRWRLREATDAAHQRLHGHEGFAAAAKGDISRPDYVDLLARLYGFHRPFERAARAAAAFDLAGAGRADMIVADLAALDAGVDGLPMCADGMIAADEPSLLGALYVVEGSTLGGVLIARALERRFAENQRRFFLGYSERQGAMWLALVARLDTLAGDDAAVDAAIASAQATFARFEEWMRDWRGTAIFARVVANCASPP